MAIDDVGRLRLFRRLEEVLGLDEAEILMAQLPVRGWHDVATKDDIAAVCMGFVVAVAAVLVAALKVH